ncbi:DUF1298 domain-containing protein [Thermoleophilia bacterium SCSIO 60948]|nr:DUF1298 domain-containing protein [Thermoleophilia bacterium SCSIO 60948]
MQPTPLSREDRAILTLESETIAGHTAKIIGVGPGAPDLERLGELIAGRIDRVPELTRVLDDSTAEPRWVDATSFELSDHLGPADVGGPVARRDLPAIVAGLFAERLPRDRPLWRMDVVELDDGGRVLVWRIHHALADGTASTRFARELLWDPVGPLGPVEHARARAALDDERRRRHLLGVLRREFARSRDGSPFDGEVGRQRRIAFAVAPLQQLHDVARARADATLNDAVLSVLAGALGRWMRAHHGDLGQIRVKVPVSLHHEGDQVANRDSFFSVPLPLNEPDPVTRLWDVHMATSERKHDHDAEELDELTRGLARISPHLADFCSRVEESPRRFALNVSNVPGPKRPVALDGAPVRALHSIAEIGEHHALRVSVISCANELFFGFCADPAIVADLDALADGVTLEVDALLSA